MVKIAHKYANVGTQLLLVILSLANARVRQDGRAKNARKSVHRAPMAKTAVKGNLVCLSLRLSLSKCPKW